MNYLEFYNKPINTVFYRMHGEKLEEWRLVKKQVLAFGELRMVLKKGYSKPIYIWWDEYDVCQFFDHMRLDYV